MHRAFRARWVFPIQSPPIRDGIVAVDGSAIAHVGAPTTGWPLTDTENMAILPGWINAHTHLEFSDLEAPLGYPGIPLPDWIATIVQYRRTRDAENPRRQTAAIRQGIAESLRHGVTMLGEIATAAWPVGTVSDLPARGIVFRELLGVSPERIGTQHQSARWHLSPNSLGPGWSAGLSPHAPYSVHPDLLMDAVSLAREARVPVAMHVAESPEEIQLLASHRGPLVPLLEQLGAWHPGAIPRGWRPLDYLRILAQAPRALVIHGNYLTDDEIGFLAARADRMSVVFCPRTHRFFRHRRYPLDQMLARGVHVALGTDSRGSTPDLSLLGEMRQVARDYPEIAPAQILRMGTVQAAEAMGQRPGSGTLTPGTPADLVFVALPDREGDPYELLLDAETPVAATVCHGHFVPGSQALSGQTQGGR